MALGRKGASGGRTTGAILFAEFAREAGLCCSELFSVLALRDLDC